MAGGEGMATSTVGEAWRLRFNKGAGDDMLIVARLCLIDFVGVSGGVIVTIRLFLMEAERLKSEEDSSLA